MTAQDDLEVYLTPQPMKLIDRNVSAKTGTELETDDLKIYSSCSKFADSTWVIDKEVKGRNASAHCCGICLGQNLPELIGQDLRRYALHSLRIGMRAQTINTEVCCVRSVLKKSSKWPVDSVAQLSRADIIEMYTQLFSESNQITERRKITAWTKFKKFLRALGYNEQFQATEKIISPSFPKYNGGKSDRYIPDAVTRRLDSIFMTNKNIPLVLQIFYWTVRLVPSRIIEVISLKRNCLKKIDENTFILSIPTFKQSGPYTTPSVRLIELRDEGFSKYYINLINKQIQYLDRLEGQYDLDPDFLLQAPKYSKVKIEKKDIDFMVFGTLKPRVYHECTFYRMMGMISEFYQIKDDAGKIYRFQSHPFRHNGITDRVNDGSFRPIEIAGLTYHHNTKMIEETYAHKPAEVNPPSPIVFRGRIVNTDNKKMADRIMKNPFAKKIRNLGYCSDTRRCPKGKASCLKCEYNIPSADELDCYISERSDWEKKRDLARKQQNWDYADLCDSWVEGYNCTIKKVLATLSNENLEVEDENHEACI